MASLEHPDRKVAGNEVVPVQLHVFEVQLTRLFSFFDESRQAFEGQLSTLEFMYVELLRY
jgi:hypothetical protein